MDLSTLAGLGLAAGALVVSLYMDGGHLSQLWSASAFVLVNGGTLGATIVSYPLEDILALPKIITKTLFGRKPDMTATIDTIVAMVDKARKEGLLTLQNETPKLDDPFLVRGIELVVDGTDPHAVRSIMETEIAFMEKRHKAGAGILETAGGYAPTMGIIGTVMGMVHVLGNLSNPDSLGPAIAVAFMATFYGIFTANVFWLPLGAKLKARSAAEVMMKEMVLEGVLSLQAGESPRIVREKLEVFLPPRQKRATGGGAAAEAAIGSG